MSKAKPRTRRGFGSLRKLPSKRYQATYTGPDTVRYSGPDTFATKGDAEGWLASEKRLIDLDIWEPPEQREQQKEAARTTVGEWLERFHTNLENRPNPPKESTMQSYRKVARNRILEPLAPGDEVPDITRLAGLPLVELEKSDVYRWWDAVVEAYPEAMTANQQAYKRLNAACSEAVEREMIPSNPVNITDAKRRVKSEEKYLPEDWELHAILEEMNPRYKALTSLMLFHGLRIGEAIALEQRHVKVGDIPVPWLPPVTVTVEQNAQRLQDEDGHTYLLVQPPKSDAGFRDVPIMASHVPLLFAHMADYSPSVASEVETWKGPRSVKLLTATEKGAMVFDTSYRSVLNRVKKRANVSPKINPHNGRNWLITRMAEVGAHLKEIGRVLGQEDLATILDVYMKVRAGRSASLMEKVNESMTSQTQNRLAVGGNGA